MKFLLVVSAVLAVAAASQVARKEPKAFFGFQPIVIPIPSLMPAKPPATTTKAPVKTTPRPTTTTRATTTTRPTTTTTTTTTAPPLPPPFQENPLPEGAVEQVGQMIDMYDQLKGRESEIFNSNPEAADPLDATFSSLPKEVRDILKILVDFLSSLPAGTMPNLNEPIPTISA